MANPQRLVTTVSTKGQVTLPSAIRTRREWDAGTRLLVEDTPEGVLLKPAPVFAETRPEDVFGSLPHRDRPKTLEEMDVGVLAEARRRGRFELP
ncbi:AbrB family transcriptional regulator [Mesorhizobium sp.]|uniref:AbrB/MazE/SpoVT family DNA-binding domain-containing protein n=1 Tax=Mesorhizobium sp. TaxID=1871066 RepID=UPI000FE658E0|nr:AbrB family transcriptional regulator [Mesorhizobium sp.]RWK36198.1 MAG: AbrB family transcriptional regulator [Mesorhizobium sp.]RWK64631.1 MAG: AbrB family transcriptional regulator [Mesorhizobium sp.]RWK73303.1 MAG: AbrB family transcriptional regulator [Mesorhizobium sp.]RWK75761.1 MAG: AbrB family transcriptional regulator [Mesorhizobium sp.]RWL01258.1 MAG: AbrB family transcriptional regulator [Mesorhizobium sp.]